MNNKKATTRSKPLAIMLVLLTLVLLLCLAACNDSGSGEDGFVNPGDSLGGGGTVSEDNIPTEANTTELAESIAALDVTVTSEDTTTAQDDGATVVDLSALSADYTISAAGSYVFSGTTTYSIILAKKDIALHLYFNNATLDGIFADKKPSSTIITLTGTNVMTGATADTNEDAKGTLYVKGALTVNGSGSLSVTSTTKNAIHCTGVLKIVSTTITANAYNHGVRGNEAVIVKDSTITAAATAGDGIQTDNETDDKEQGYIYFENSTINITAGDDGVQAATYLKIVSGTVNVTTNGGAPTNITESSSDNAEGKGLKAGTISYEVAEEDLATEQAKDGVTVTSSDGIYLAEITDMSYYAIIIEGGTFNLNCNDDAIHSNGYLFISGGTITAASGDDGIHAEELLQITNGTITVSKCYEGIEAAKIEISGGDISVTSTDDGVNAADGTTTQMGVVNSNCYIIVSGGYLRINASGDGLDSNGSLLISGGEVYVDGPTSSANAALDSEAGILVDGGTLVAVGAIGMVETPASNSAQYCVSYAASSSVSSGSTITLRDSNGTTLVSFTTAKASRSIIISSSSLTSGSTYSIYIDDTAATSFTVSSKITTIGSTYSGGSMGGGMKPNTWGFNR